MFWYNYYGDDMRRYIILVFICFSFYFCFKVKIDDFFQKNFFYNYIKYEGNDYYLDNDFNYFKENNSLIAYNKEDILNILYTFINKGCENFSFYCGSNYKDCRHDIDELMNDKSSILYINDFVHPYNSFHNISAKIDKNKITFKIFKNYSYSEINELNYIIKKIINENINVSMSVREKIKVLHNYLIFNTEYDNDYANDIKNSIPNDKNSYKATGALVNHLAVCSGYTDALSIMLNYLKIKNIKISNDNHVWNLIYVDNVWLHTDVTNDDLGSDVNNRYFLVNTDTIKFDGKHNFSENVYSEFQR